MTSNTPGTLSDDEWTQKPFVVEKVQFNGSVNTRAENLRVLTAPILSASTLPEILKRADSTITALKSLEAFKHIDLTLDSSSPGAVSVVFDVLDRPRIYAKTGTEIGNYEGSMTASLALRNVLGSFETISANASYGLDTSPMVKQSGTNYSLVWSKPILHPFHKIPFHSYVVSAYRNVHTQKLHSSYDLGVDGFQFKYRFPMLSEIWGLAQNEFNYDLIWREIKNAAPTASFEVREQVGHALKSSISHVLTYDTRDDPMLPRRGTLFRAASEVSGFNIPSGDSTVGLGGNVNHLKHESTLSRTTSLDILRLPTFTLTNTLKLGSLIPISPSESTHLSERFLTGGPLSIRGFEMHGLGPTAPRFDTGTLRFDSAIGRDGLGSNTYYGFSSGLMFPLLPRWKTKDVRGHLWANAGSGLDDLASSESILKKLRDSSSICIGAGLALKFSIIRLEINYCLPVRVISSDRVKSGWQWGVGMEFM